MLYLQLKKFKKSNTFKVQDTCFHNFITLHNNYKHCSFFCMELQRTDTHFLSRNVSRSYKRNVLNTFKTQMKIFCFK